MNSAKGTLWKIGSGVHADHPDRPSRKKQGLFDGRARRRIYSLERSNVLYCRVMETPRKPEEQ
ncbi:hypothetical protein D4R89_12010 [bacterium]|nr:MAG: hypothetical protein D4R89_12010 [bacterium]